MPNAWLKTAVTTTKTNGTGTARTVAVTGTNTTARDVPSITRTSTRSAVAIATTTGEDEGFSIEFSIKVRSLLATVPEGAASPPNPICS